MHYSYNIKYHKANSSTFPKLDKNCQHNVLLMIDKKLQNLSSKIIFFFCYIKGHKTTKSKKNIYRNE